MKEFKTALNKLVESEKCTISEQILNYLSSKDSIIEYISYHKRYGFYVRYKYTTNLISKYMMIDDLLTEMKISVTASQIVDFSLSFCLSLSNNEKKPKKTSSGIYESDDELERYYSNFNKSTTKLGIKIEIPEFVYNPNDVRATFLSLVTETYPNTYEDEVVKYLPPNLTKDKHGNYYIIVGDDPTTMFTSHLDTASAYKRNVIPHSYIDISGDEIIVSDGTTILGADDKAGVTIMMHMIHNNISGIYYFFIGEERGCIGSRALALDFANNEFLSKVTKCISFDRRRTTSIITSQSGSVCCSTEFKDSLVEEFKKGGLSMVGDPTGSVTDSKSFMYKIPECTNISVGYLNEHSSSESQNISYLARLASACLLVNWANLTVTRDHTINPILIKKREDEQKLVKLEEVKDELLKVDGLSNIKASVKKEYHNTILISVSYTTIDELYKVLDFLSNQKMFENRSNPQFKLNNTLEISIW